ncbi:GLPGLI family protein [Flavobacterium sp. GP15]|uniref:GLPGLI family protein n=1 Tax=Flavobacterium sp. GP15 TaxID=2758567 RepID=UPI00165DE822|nr:GLPGLI family protein [Flavobacterium sp. GP15]
MKNTITLFFIFFVLNSTLAQSGKVFYNVQMSVDLGEVPKDKKDFITQMVNDAKTQQFELLFNKSKSSFKINKKLDNLSEYEVKMKNIASMAFTSSSEIYIDIERKIEIDKTKEGVLIESIYSNTNWEISTESKIIADYTCYKAIKKIFFVNRKGQRSVKEVTAWFAPSLPYSFGPKNFYGLPGLILELTENRTTYLAAVINLNDNTITIDFPKGKTVTKEVYEKGLQTQMGM